MFYQCTFYRVQFAPLKVLLFGHFKGQLFIFFLLPMRPIIHKILLNRTDRFCVNVNSPSQVETLMWSSFTIGIVSLN